MTEHEGRRTCATGTTGIVLAAIAALLGAGCHTMRFELVNEQAARVVTEHKSYFFWGLTPTVEVDVLKHCPYGAAAIREQTTFADGLLAVPTLGVWCHRSTTYYCRGPHAGGAAPR